MFKWFLLLVVLLVFNEAVQGNIYQTCSNGASQYSENHYWWYYHPPVYNDAGPLALSPNSHYSLELDDGSTIYFNVCGSTNICEGAYACRYVNGELYNIYASPGGDVYYSSGYQSSTSFYLSFDSHIAQTHCDYASFSITLLCASNPSLNITSISTDYDGDCTVQIYANSLYGCNKAISGVPSYITPNSYSDFTSQIYLQGMLPMFSLDHVAVSNYEQSFVGQIYYSEQYNSMLLNGTLTGGKSGSSQVSYLYQGNVPGNPPRLYARITPPGFSSPVCILLSSYIGNDQTILEFFSTSANPYTSMQRSYTSVYFNKGSTFNVNTWTASPTYAPFITLQQRTSDNKVVSIGSNLLASPIVDYDDWPAFISEVNWNAISTTSLPESLFNPPSYWNCPDGN